MNRQFFLPFSSVVVALIQLAAVPVVADDRADVVRPNIVFLMTDDQAAGAVGCYGNREIITPHLDNLARDGVRFSNHYATTSICTASRCSVLTGLYEYRHGCNFDHGDLRRQFFAASYPAKLRASGYYTGFAGKIGFELKGEPFAALQQEFDEWAAGPGQTEYETIKNQSLAKYASQYPHCTRAYAAWAKDFLKAAKQTGRPFCMNISFKAPHLPFRPDPIDSQLYEHKTKFARHPNDGVENGRHLSPQALTSRAAKEYRQWITNFDETCKSYYALISGVDAAVGMIREALEQEGFAENTVIIFTSDNGYNCGAHGFGDKVLPYEEASRIPLIIYDPRRPKLQTNHVCAALTANVDMAPTILALAHVPSPSDIDGINLAPLLGNPDGNVRDVLPLFSFWGIPSAQSMAIVTPEWKYIYWYYGDQMQPTEELFHLTHDRLEMANLASSPQHTNLRTSLRLAYDAELVALRTKVVPDHGYPKYGKLFDRAIPWEQKADLLKPK
ncbi:sulfatase family protein [Schlesneria paludicola]|uniref:sulfatase family protein n=1 Tax=Schlesneria paludicola TaxID=360056 RepID=UPI00029A9E8D|nr:sulfatase [Schlesneria paludicola]